MRIDPYTIGSIIHVTKRGARGMDIVRDNDDCGRFIDSLFYLNDTHSDPNWHRVVAELPAFVRPSEWPERQPLVRVLAWTLLSNHFHLLLQEISEGGTAKYMQRLCGSMSMCFNQKYKEKGSLFQGAYHARVVDEDAHMNYLAFYILVKNVLEMYPKGLTVAYTNFNDAWEWAKKYQYSSFAGLISGMDSPIVEDEESMLASIIGKGNAYKKEANELLEAHLASRGKEFKNIMLEPW